MITEDRVMTIYAWFQESYYHLTKRKIRLPSNTDPTKTYQYRWVRSFTEKVEGWELSDGAVKFLIKEVIKYSKKNKLLSRGVGVLSKMDILEECYRQLKFHMDNVDQVLKDVGFSHQFFSKNKKNALEYRGVFTNFVLWFKSGKICKEYMALSQTCLTLLYSLDRRNQEELPGAADLVLTRRRCLANELNKEKIKALLGEDLKDED